MPDTERHKHFRPLGGNSADDETGNTVFARIFHDHNPHGEFWSVHKGCKVCAASREVIVVE